MATPDGGFAQGLLQSISPWLTGSSPSTLDNSFQQYGGTQGLLNALMQGDSPANFGRAMQSTQTQALQRAAQRQQLAMGNIGVQQNAAMFPFLMGALRQYGGSPQASPNAPGAAVAAPPGAPPQPQGQPPGQPQAQPQAPQGGGPSLQNGLGLARILSLMGRPGANTFLQSLTADPSYVTQKAVAGNALTQDRSMYQQAMQQGDPRAAQAAYIKFLKDSGQVNVAAYNGAVTTLGGLTPSQVGASTENPVQGVQTVNGVESPIPGAAGTQQALAAAKSLGGAAGRTINVGGIPIPALDALGRGRPASQSAAGASQAATAGNASSSAPSSFADILRQGSYQKELGEEGGKQVMGYQEAADAARNANYALDQMIQDGQKVSLGPAAGVKEWGLKATAGIGQMFGISPPQELSSYQELDKYANQVAFAATRQMGSREAAQIVHLQMQSNPNKELTAPAFMDLAGSMKAMNNYIMAKNVAIQQASQANGGNTALASAKWTQQIDPRVWDLALSPQMGEKWASTVGKSKITAAWPYLTPDEQSALVANIPMSVRAQWLKTSSAP